MYFSFIVFVVTRMFYRRGRRSVYRPRVIRRSLRVRRVYRRRY